MKLIYYIKMMKKTGLAGILEKIPRDEFIRFGDYLKSPFFNVPNRILKLYFLMEKPGNFPLTREIISEAFYPGKQYSQTEINVRKLISDFKICFNRFLAEREFEDQKFEQKLNLLRQLRKRQMTAEYTKIFEETKKILSCSEIKDEEYYRKMHDLISEQYLFEGFHYKKYSDDLSFSISENMDLYFMAYKLFLSQRFEAREYALKTNIHKEPKFYNEICREINSNIELYKQHPEIYCRYLMMLLKKEKNKKELFSEYISYLNYVEEELKIKPYSYYQDLLNHCIRMVNYGKSEYEERIIEFAWVMENKNMFQKYGISSNNLKIIAESAIGMESYDWAEQFIKRNIKYLDEFDHEGIYNLTLAKIYFFKKNFQDSRKYLIKVSYEDYVYYIDAKLIEARINYEEKYFEDISFICETVKKYLRSHIEIGDIYKRSYLAFIGLLNRLVKLYDASLTENANDYDIKKIKDDILSYPELLYGDKWLLDKLNEIKKEAVSKVFS